MAKADLWVKQVHADNLHMARDRLTAYIEERKQLGENELHVKAVIMIRLKSAYENFLEIHPMPSEVDTGPVYRKYNIRPSDYSEWVRLVCYYLSL